MFQVEDLKAERENALKQRDRLKRMRDEKEKFFANLNEARMSVYKVMFTILMIPPSHSLPIYVANSSK